MKSEKKAQADRREHFVYVVDGICTCAFLYIGAGCIYSVLVSFSVRSVVCLLCAVAVFLLVERKLLGRWKAGMMSVVGLLVLAAVSELGACLFPEVGGSDTFFLASYGLVFAVLMMTKGRFVYSRVSDHKASGR
jgi:hypothetical protein